MNNQRRKDIGRGVTLLNEAKALLEAAQEAVTAKIEEAQA